ncbi:MAG: tetratricopeptide repeat protein [Cyanobacteria bacterium P01_D01_bin.71]
MSTTQNLLGGRYQLISVLNEQPSGRTMLAADAHYPGHPHCVVRELHLPTRNPMTRQFILRLLKQKAAVLEDLGQHPQIPNAYAAFDVEQSFYIVQEFIPGRSLDEELQPGQPWSPSAVTDFLREVLPVLGFAQAHGVVHGNLKPSKLIRHAETGQLMVLDFGSIKNVSQKVTSKGQTSTHNFSESAHPIYLAPEQLHNQPLFCSDHYALGMMVVQALTGLPVNELPTAQNPEQPEILTSLLKTVPSLDPALSHLLSQMVHAIPERRYQKATDILAELERWQEVTPPAPPAPPHPPAVEWQPAETSPVPTASRARRSWPWPLVGALGLAALIGATAVVAFKLPQRFIARRHLNAAAAVATDDPQAAIDRYTQALALLPDHAEALIQRGQLYFDSGNPEAALADISAAIAQAPDSSDYVYERANMRFNLGDVQGAIDDYTQAISKDASFAKAYANRGSARASWGDDRGAIDDYTQAIALAVQPEIEAAAYLNRCLSYSNLNEQQLALNDCSAAINLRPSHALAYQNRGLVRRRLGDFQGSLQDYNIAIQIEPNSPDPYYNRGLTRQVLNDLSGAMADFSQAIAIDANYVFAIYDRGLLHAQFNDIQAALTDLQTASRLCLDLGRTGCYEDAQFQISRLQRADEADDADAGTDATVPTTSLAE